MPSAAETIHEREPDGSGVPGDMADMLKALATRLLRNDEDNAGAVASELLLLAQRISSAPAVGSPSPSRASTPPPTASQGSVGGNEVEDAAMPARKLAAVGQDSGTGVTVRSDGPNVHVLNEIGGAAVVAPCLGDPNGPVLNVDSTTALAPQSVDSNEHALNASDGTSRPEIGPDFKSSLFDVVLATVVSESDHHSRVHGRTFFGTAPVGGQATPTVVGPLEDEFLFPESELCIAPHPAKSKLRRNPEIIPPVDVYYPLASAKGYDLKSSRKYLRGFVYVAPYDLHSKLKHRELLLNTTVPPGIGAKLENDVFVSVPLPGMIEMIPGVPFALEYNGDPNRLHTVACSQTLDSLRAYKDYPQILQCSVKLAKLTWGCQAHGQTPAINPIYDIPGLKVNDRSAKRADFQHSSKDGSFSLSSTVIKGEGQGTFAPAIQANTEDARVQISSVLQILHELYRLVMPKCLSKFEMEMIDFHSVFNNVFGFGGLGPNGTSVQINVSSTNIKLVVSLGDQGGVHSDFKDDKNRWTFLAIMLRIPPTADPGPFCLARPGLYIRERGVWIQFLVFKGVDLHFGHEPTEDIKQREIWALEQANDAWNMAGPQNRVAYVTYFSDVPSNRTGSLNVMPPTFFGNFGSSQAHKDQQKNFAFHGLSILGNQEAYANKLAREIVYNFWNSLQLCDLDLDLELSSLFNKMSFRQSGGKGNKPLAPPEYLPDQHGNLIQRFKSLWAWHTSEAEAFWISMPKAILAKSLKRTRQNNLVVIQKPFALPSAIPAVSEASSASQLPKKNVKDPAPRKILPLRKSKKATPMQTARSDTSSDSDTASESESGSEDESESGSEDESVPARPPQPQEIEYEVERITSHRRNTDGTYSWYVKWKDYDEFAWLNDKELETCIELLDEYNHAHGISPESMSVESPKSDSHKAAKKPRNVGSSVSLASNLRTLIELFDLDKLKDEVAKLERLYRNPKPSDYFRNINLLPLIEKWGHQVEQITNLGDLLSHEHEKSSDEISIEKALLRLKSVQVSLYPDYRPIDTQELRVDIIKRSAKHEICLALISVYEWHSHIGPLAAQHIANKYLSDGYSALRTASLSLADLTDHIAQWICKRLLEHRETERLKKKLIMPIHPFGTDLSHCANLQTLPGNLYGFLLDDLASRDCILPQISKQDLNKLEVRPILEHCLLNIWSRYAILPQLRILDRGLNSAKNTDMSESRILDRSLTRGSILWAIRHACQGDGIFSSAKIDAFLKSPAALFNGHICRDYNFSSAVMKSKEITLRPLIEWIKLTVNDQPEIKSVCDRLRELQHHLMFELFQGYSSPMDADIISDTPDRVLAKPAKPSKKSALSSRNTLGLSSIPQTGSLLSLLIGSRTGISLAKAALIIREALNEARGLKPSSDIFHRVLKGVHSTTSSNISHNPDHTNPIRARLRSADLLRKHLADQPLTSDNGISNLLAWFGTGQGYKTSAFLDSIDSGFFSTTAEKMVSKFQAAIDSNVSLVARYPNKSLSDKHLPGYYQVDDILVWGQPCKEITLNPSIGHNQKMSTQEKFERYWTPEIQAKWRDLLGPLYNEDYRTYTGRRPDWITVHTFVTDIKVNGFKSGLTPFQLCNSLSILGIVNPPTIDDMAHFICSHAHLGAWKALQNLGFSIPESRSFMPVLIAFTSIYNHLEQHLSEEDKKLLNFDAIFVEHLLCKVSRWESRLALEGALDHFTKAAMDLEEDSTSANLPFPATINRAYIEQIILTSKDI